MPGTIRQKKQPKKSITTDMMPPKPVVENKASNEKPLVELNKMQLLVPQILDMGSPTQRQNKFKSIYNQNYN